jgi:hypothetical protein
MRVENDYAYRRRSEKRTYCSSCAAKIKLVKERDCEPKHNEGRGKRCDFHFLPVHPESRCGGRGRLRAQSVIVCSNLGMKSEEKHHQTRGQQQEPPDAGMFDQVPHRNKATRL